ncbi:unnamed protein product [Acanthosepion pharaonis]|uniref:Uncharacterized protein n=1 Tax=Acanthosepion pharaonis TaxID=158019 RepID=A0A812D131_ACAPH|nr:unnamed protein product [Sepia pharaonis]
MLIPELICLVLFSFCSLHTLSLLLLPLTFTPLPSTPSRLSSLLLLLYFHFILPAILNLLNAPTVLFFQSSLYTTSAGLLPFFITPTVSTLLLSFHSPLSSLLIHSPPSLFLASFPYHSCCPLHFPLVDIFLITPALFTSTPSLHDLATLLLPLLFTLAPSFHIHF